MDDSRIDSGLIAAGGKGGAECVGGESFDPGDLADSGDFPVCRFTLEKITLRRLENRRFGQLFRIIRSLEGKDAARILAGELGNLVLLVGDDRADLVIYRNIAAAPLGLA